MHVFRPSFQPWMYPWTADIEMLEVLLTITLSDDIPQVSKDVESDTMPQKQQSQERKGGMCFLLSFEE